MLARHGTRLCRCQEWFKLSEGKRKVVYVVLPLTGAQREFPVGFGKGKPGLNDWQLTDYLPDPPELIGLYDCGS